MASALVWKVYSGGELVASTKFAEDAAAVVGNTVRGAVRVDGRVVWRDGRDGHACESYDAAAAVMIERRQANTWARYARLTGLTDQLLDGTVAR